MLDAAEALILELGTQATTLKGVGERAGYSRGLAQARFGSHGINCRDPDPILHRERASLNPVIDRMHAIRIDSAPGLRLAAPRRLQRWHSVTKPYRRLTCW